MWSSLIAQGVPPCYVQTLSKLYAGQYASVQSDARSRAFPIQKGTKQGDPISPLIFNSVLEEVMRETKSRWARNKFGLQLGHERESTLTNFRFADDIILIGRSLPQIKKMIADVSEVGGRVGLQLHPEKTKVQHNNIGYGSRVRTAKVKDMNIEVMDPGSCTMYLGRLLSLSETHNAELNHRIKKGWAKYGMLKQELTDKAVPLHLRLKLFLSVITPTILYGCCSWVMTGAQETMLRTTQMKMLRLILGRRRKNDASTMELESWLDWMHRTTAEVRALMVTHAIPHWVDEQRVRAKNWKKRIEGMDPDRLPKLVMDWTPEGRRSRGRPRLRWQDTVCR
jgi:hypothetical protein